MAETQSLLQFCRCLDLTTVFSRFPAASPSSRQFGEAREEERRLGQEAWPTHKSHPIHAPFPQATPRAPLTAQGPAFTPPRLAASPAPSARASPVPRPAPLGSSFSAAVAPLGAAGRWRRNSRTVRVVRSWLGPQRRPTRWAALRVPCV